jgi:hypothetical protein
MIHEPTVEVTCDGPDCKSGRGGFPCGTRVGTGTDDDVRRGIRAQGWVVRDGKEYCSERCAIVGARRDRNPCPPPRRPKGSN